MRILYHSAAPWVKTGYGTCTEEIAPRLHNGEHDVAIQTLSSVRNEPIWWHGDELEYDLEKKMRIYHSNGRFGLMNVEDNFNKYDADVLFTHFDTWMDPARSIIPDLEVPYASYVIVDHDPAPDAVVEQVNNAHEVIAMSKYAVTKLEDKGVRPIYIPHGVNTDVHRPLSSSERPEEIKVANNTGEEKLVDLDDTFIFGMVAANHGDRKNIPNHLEAFKMFLEHVDSDALLYVHTEQNAREGYNLNDIVEEIGIPQQNIIWASAEDYGSVGKEYLNKWYNAFDVLMNISMGESWGLTITEAMAAGTPAIVSNFSSMPEQLGVDPNNPDDYIRWPENYSNNGKTVGVAPHGVVIEPDAHIWREKVSSRQMMINPESIFEGMRFYYEQPGIRQEDGRKAREHVENNYSWKDQVIPAFEQMFNTLETVVQ